MEFIGSPHLRSVVTSAEKNYMADYRLHIVKTDRAFSGTFRAPPHQLRVLLREQLESRVLFICCYRSTPKMLLVVWPFTQAKTKAKGECGKQL